MCFGLVRVLDGHHCRDRARVVLDLRRRAVASVSTGGQGGGGETGGETGSSCESTGDAWSEGRRTCAITVSIESSPSTSSASRVLHTPVMPDALAPGSETVTSALAIEANVSKSAVSHAVIAVAVSALSSKAIADAASTEGSAGASPPPKRLPTALKRPPRKPSSSSFFGAAAASTGGAFSAKFGSYVGSAGGGGGGAAALSSGSEASAILLLVTCRAALPRMRDCSTVAAFVCSVSFASTDDLFLGSVNEIVRPGSAPSGTVITTFSGMPGIVSLSLLPGFVLGGTSSSYICSSASPAAAGGSGAAGGGAAGGGGGLAAGGSASAAPGLPTSTTLVDDFFLPNGFSLESDVERLGGMVELPRSIARLTHTMKSDARAVSSRRFPDVIELVVRSL